MPVLRDFECANENCRNFGEAFETMANAEDIVLCSACECRARPIPVASKSYKIKGANDSSITPKKHAGVEGK